MDGVNKDILILLNSPGGDAFQGIEIYNYLKNHSSHITVEFTALAESAASIIEMAADELV
ncbi:ATP-dependent Clp protease proteolytic subunit, partial [Staphylococcus felis]|uniref:ATP-dependent Clp protease proteolytic subunit n=1 Tax=Staphylococcus felis TaxID=46127 RepID=UPI001E339F2F